MKKPETLVAVHTHTHTHTKKTISLKKYIEYREMKVDKFRKTRIKKRVYLSISTFVRYNTRKL